MDVIYAFLQYLIFIVFVYGSLHYLRSHSLWMLYMVVCSIYSVYLWFIAASMVTDLVVM